MVRGIQLILKGRDPREAWAFAQRICGVCTLVHGIASVRAVENALNYKNSTQCAASSAISLIAARYAPTTSCISIICMRWIGWT